MQWINSKHTLSYPDKTLKYTDRMKKTNKAHLRWMFLISYIKQSLAFHCK